MSHTLSELQKLTQWFFILAGKNKGGLKFNPPQLNELRYPANFRVIALEL